MTGKQRTLIHFGCGPLATKTRWDDYDGSWNLWVSKLPQPFRGLMLRAFGNEYQWPAHVHYADLNDRLPFDDCSIDAFYASHVWEHLYYEDAIAATREVLRVLKKGGIIRLAVPNLAVFAEEYVAKMGASGAAMELNQKLLFRDRARSKSMPKKIYAAMTDFHSHKFMYDPPSLINLLTDQGFLNVSEMPVHVSRISEITDVESVERVSDTAGFSVEGIKG